MTPTEADIEAVVEADENGNNEIELMNEDDHIDNEAELVIRKGED